VSLINQNVADKLRHGGVKVWPGEGEVQLADGTRAATPGTMFVPIRLGKRTVKHTFGILLGMEDPVIIGIDLQARLRVSVPTPLLSVANYRHKCSTTKGLTEGNLEEQKLLAKNLANEMRKFESVQGPTDRT